MDQKDKKNKLRKEYFSLQSSLPLERKEKASLRCCQFLESFLADKGNILSFASKEGEIDILPLNESLKRQCRLFLTKVEGNHLSIYHIDPSDPMVLSSFGILEPTPSISKKVDVDAIDLFLVPGVCFDSSYHRIGYGKGHIDRLMAKIREKNPHAKCIGIGFLEQKSANPIPYESHDIPLDDLFLF